MFLLDAFTAVAAFVARILSFFVSPILWTLRSRHNVPNAVAGRKPPDAAIFPFYMQNKQNLWLYWRRWAPTTTVLSKCRGIFFLVGGLGEHCARYDGVAQWLTSQGFVAFSIDHQGQGASEGERVYVERFADYVDDVEQFVKHVAALHPELSAAPKFLLGHSMGGLIATHVALRQPRAWNAVILSGPALEADPKVATPFMKGLVRTIGDIVPKLGVDSLDITLISRNDAVVQLAQDDPLYPKRPLRARWAAEMLVAMDGVWANIKRANFNALLVLHGQLDRICSPSGSQRIVREAPTKDKRLIEFPGFFHELFNDKAHATVFNELLNFIEAHL